MVLRMKKCTTLLLAVLMTLFVCLACGSSMNVEMLRNGKGSVTLTVNKASVEEIAPDRESFEAYFNDYVSAINSQSGAIQALDVKRFEESETQYYVTVKTRLIDKVTGLGKIRYGDTKSFFETNTNNVDDLRDGYDGFIIPSILRVYPSAPSKTYQTYYTDEKTNLPVMLNNIKIEAKSTESGNIVKFKDFQNTLLSTDKSNILFFQLVDFQFV